MMPKQESGTTDKIILAAQRRMRDAGFHGVSFREIAADVGIKSASVHHHFPTKDDLGAAVAEDYTRRFMRALGDPDDAERKPKELLALYVDLFRQALMRDEQMCLCGVLASEMNSLPNGVTKSGRSFFRHNLAWLETVLRRKSPSMDPDRCRAEALRIFAGLEGAMLIAKGLDQPEAFEIVAATIAK